MACIPKRGYEIVQENGGGEEKRSYRSHKPDEQDNMRTIATTKHTAERSTQVTAHAMECDEKLNCFMGWMIGEVVYGKKLIAVPMLNLKSGCSCYGEEVRPLLSFEEYIYAQRQKASRATPFLALPASHTSQPFTTNE
jgi:hypothetical protein